MSDLLLGMSFVVLFAYGYWLMSRLDRFVFHADDRHGVRVSLAEARRWVRVKRRGDR